MAACDEARILVARGGEAAMIVTGEVKCLHCGYVSGSWAGVSGAPLTAAGFTAAGEAARDADANTAIHCGRCGGPVFLNDASAVRRSDRLRRIERLRAQLAAYDAPDEGFAA